MPPRTINDLERIRYRSGQALAARDLRDSQDFEALFRWLHNRYLHGAWGIASGLQVENLGGGVRVLPGIAYDGYGRELVLSRPAEFRFPELAIRKACDLVMRYQESREFPHRSPWQEVCLPKACADTPAGRSRRFSPLQEQPAFRWRPAGTAHLGEEVPLVRASRATTAEIELDHSPRRNTAALTRPHIGYGTALIDPLSLLYWFEDVGRPSPEFVGAQVEVNTSSAGFAQTPCYVHMAQLQVRDEQRVRLVLPMQALLPFPAFESIADPQPDRFTYRIIVPSKESFFSSLTGGPAGVIAPRAFRAQAPEPTFMLSIAWLGIEPAPEVPSGSHEKECGK